MEGLNKYIDNNTPKIFMLSGMQPTRGGGRANENGYLRPINRGSNINNQSVVCG